MRILYFTRDYTVHDRRFLTALAATDHEVYYMALERLEYHKEQRALPSKIKPIKWSGGRKPFHWLITTSLLFNLKKVLSLLKPDLIHAGPIQTSAFLSALSGFHPLVSMSWGYDLLHDADRNLMMRWITRYCLRKSDVLVGDCDSVRQKAIAFGMPDERIVTFPWGVDLQKFRVSGAILNSNNSFTLLSTRGWEPIYGVEIIAKAFVLAYQQHPELRLVMLGNGSQTDRIYQIFMEGGISDQVSFPGQVGQNDLPNYYNSADLYVSASRSDGSSISLLEAMASGLPVLVSDIPGNREWVTPGEQGWLFPDGDAEALAHAILNAVDNRTELKKLGNTARQTSVKRADWNQNFKLLLDAYKLAINLSD